MPASLGTNVAKFLSEVSGNAGKSTISPVPGTTILSLSGRPLSSSLKNIQSSGPDLRPPASA